MVSKLDKNDMSSSNVNGLSMLDQILNACEAWNVDEVHRIVDSKTFFIDAFDDDHVTALQMAASTGNIGIVEYLLDNGADIEKSNQVGMTPLHHACRNGHINVVRILVQRGANYQKLTYLGASAMTLAAAGGHIDVVKLLLDLRLSVNPSHTALCPTPIIAAALRRHTHICALLTHRGAYVDGHIARLWNLSALSVAITCGATSVVRALLELGANASFRSLGGRTAIELASSLNRDDIVTIITKTLKSSFSEDKPTKIDLRAQIIVRDELAIRSALRERIPTYTSLPEGCTPLMYAVLLADTATVRAIIEEGSNLNAVENISGFTALMFAAILGDAEMIECLLNAGADASITSSEGLTAFDYAVASGMIDAEMLCLLQQHMERGFIMPPKSELHQQLSRVIHSGKSKILNKISSHVGLSVSLGVGDRKEPSSSSLSREHFERIIRASNDVNQSEFIVASDILRSIAHNIRFTNKNDDPLHNCIRVARYVAEQRATQGWATSPVALISDESQQNSGMSAKYGNSIDSTISGKSQCSERQKEYFSLAQRNADIFYEYRFPKGDYSRKGTIGSIKTRLLFDDENRRKISSSTSASGSDGEISSIFELYNTYVVNEYKLDKSPQVPPTIQGCNLFDHHGSTNTLGTTPRIRMRSRETVKMDECDEDENDRSSPSRLSLNQYTFALPDDKIPLRKSTSTPMLGGAMICRSSSSSCLKVVTNSARNSARNAVSSVDYVPKYSRRRAQEDSLWTKLREAGLGTYVDLLKSEEVDKGTFLSLTNEDLIDLGISNTLHRNSLLKLAKAIRSS
ncbi:unnamed protein product [Anisakis simplex]|uniref:SAM domain-containing protein n=1 Tax=Anisakis simplex TaxID=6269 RepID=A0A0M3JUI9_ANISI|nr:unnamed protein product [Anisakis simplex]